MGFLDSLFQEVVPEMPIAVDIVSADASVDVGFLYRVAASDSGVTLAMSALGLEPTTSKRFAVKLVAAGTLTVLAPEGHNIEADDGAMGSGVLLSELSLGEYREWLCDADHNWLLVGEVTQ